MATLRLRIELNPGGEGVRMDKLANVTAEAEKLLRSVLSDLGVASRVGDWISKSFYESSVGYDAELGVSVDPAVVNSFNETLRYLITYDSSPALDNGKIGLKTYRQFVTFGKSLDPDEKMRVGLYENGGAGPRWETVSRQPALNIESEVVSPLVYYGAVHGRLGTWYKEGNYFDLRDPISNNLVKCRYSKDKYSHVYELYKDQDAVVHVSGKVTADRLEGVPDEVEVDQLEYYESLSDEEFRRMFGLVPDLTGEESTEGYIDRIRRDDDA